MDPAKHVSKNKETDMYCVYDSKGKKVKEFEDKKDAVAYATKNHDDLMKEAKVYSKPAKLPRAVAMNPKVRAAQKAHANGDWDGNVDKEGNAVVHINSKPHTVTTKEGMTKSADRKPETYRKPDGKMGTRMVPTDREVVKEGTEIGQTKWAEVKRFAGGDKMGGMGIQISGLNGQGKSTMDQVRQKGAYIQLPLKEIPKLIKLLQTAVRSKNEEVEEVNELDTSTLVSYRKKANKQRYSNNISKRPQRTDGVDRADKKLRARGIDKFGNKESVEEVTEAMSPSEKAAHDRAVAAFKARGGKVKKLPPGKAAGYHGKDDPGAGVHGMLNKPDTGKFGTKKKVKSMTNSVNEDEDTNMKTFFDIRREATLEANGIDEGIFTGLQKKGSSDSQAGAQTRSYQRQYGTKSNANPHNHEMHAKAAFKSGMKSKSQIIKHVEKKTGQKIHPDVHKMVHNSSGLSD